MSATLLLENVGIFSLQAGGLIVAGLPLPRLLRLARPLAFFQALLLAVLLLPVLQSWTRPVMVVSRVSQARVALPAAMLERVDTVAPVDWAFISLCILGAGVAARVAWLFLGLARLRSLRKYAEGIDDGVAVSTEIAGPVTFGFWRPIILLPPSVLALPAAARAAILAHERAHIRRGDWLFALWEEIVLCVLWFHPAVWLLVSRIRLAREQVVDFEASRAAASREIYVDALLAVADARMQPYFAPAPPFLRRRQLAARIQSLLLEVPMSRLRIISSYGVAAVLTVAVALWVTSSFPLRGAPQLAGPTPENVSVQGAELVFSTRPLYPIAARRANVEGTVTVEVTLAANGEVADARVIAGPPELRRAALDAVLNWQFKPGGSVARVVIEFRQPAGGTGERLTAIEIAGGIPAPLAETLRARLQPFIGQPVSGEIHSTVQKISRALTVRIEQNVAGGAIATTAIISAGLAGVGRGVPGGAIGGIVGSVPGGIPSGAIGGIVGSVPGGIPGGTIGGIIGAVPPEVPSPLGNVPGTIRVGGQVQAANLISQVVPIYPALARQARIQGTVRFNVTIDRAGAVSAMQLVSGHPVLILAAQEALRQYRYNVTQLNGQPVEVATQVDVNFIL